MLRIVGVALLIMAGLIYTIERAFTMLSTSIVQAGFFAGNMSGEVPDIKMSSFTDNLFVPLFFVLGIITLVYSFPKK
ncbi:hypothetical protein J2D69_10290 [Lysinibacillus sphaericus]|uniref:Uncharacterized protein n=2 Tax=Lysinibacillus sphaericus TaxID=1421 RepID=W7RU98_LYSSH|nr:hypothetical protein [Lysinibacillus sphaericus]EWH34214.1 hypothetical protein P799_08145 [Lysinibacillus sphaericus CBAM5]MBG9725697.1 hypothetical protein [Lysinibacillus fusiformis]AMO33826.1 hypothetical protein AR327_16035 [Lysinibacillus sphaericus]AMR91065.1 hypothetical protein A1T07_13175 [Lysinibacillus sphaericus]ANA45114.1 hypothetical protein A2J09_05840 [Lysinibacillus sphaericus]